MQSGMIMSAFQAVQHAATMVSQLANTQPTVVPGRRFGIAFSAELALRSSLVANADGGLPLPLRVTPDPARPPEEAVVLE